MKSFLILPFLASLVASFPSPLQQQPFKGHGHGDGEGDKVNVSLYVMSRCPDARLCEDVFQSVTSKEGVLDKINLDIGYIGTPNKSEPLGVSCKHGQIECIGNAQQLCLLKHLSIEKAYSIIQCQNYPSNFPKDIGNLDSLKKCVKTVREVDWWGSGIGRCIEGQHNNTFTLPEEEETLEEEEEIDDANKKLGLGKEAIRLLYKNIRKTYEKGIKTSCTIDITSTINLEGKRRCIVDDGVWRGCDDGHTAQDFIRVIEEEYKNLQSKKDD